ncbi:hypothetical protein BMS3Abin03_00084 [bacterium BMS3Abin03]|nr:hypothetical protein BMS3Abin03_00084 [bacterium BMS3Abin03]
MEEKKIQSQINEINRKLDIVLEEIELQRKHRREIDDLKDDLMRVGNDLYATAVTELEDVHDYLETGDILHLGKKLLRNVKTMNKMFDQIESARDFLEDVSPLIRESIIDIMNKLDEYDRKGYFQFIKQSETIIENVITSFSPEDVKALGDNIVTILNTIKNLTQPDMLQAINNAVSVYKKLDIEIEDDVSYFQLFKTMNTPEMRKGIAFGIKFLKSLAETQTTNGKLTTVKKEQTN